MNMEYVNNLLTSERQVSYFHACLWHDIYINVVYVHIYVHVYMYDYKNVVLYIVLYVYVYLQM